VRADAKEERYVKRPFKEDRLNTKRSAAPRDFGDRPREDRPRFARSDDRPPSRGPRKEFSRDDDRRPSRPPRREYSRDGEGDRPARAPRKPFARDDERGASRGPRRDFVRPDRDRSERPARPPRVKKSGERIAKIVARAGLCSRRDAEEWITQGRVAVNGRIITSPALDVTANDIVTIDGAALPARERTRLFLYHKPRGLVTTHADPEGRPTVFDALPKDLPRLISVGRLDFNTEGLLLLTNDGGLARALELPDTGWLRRYRVRAHGSIDQAKLDALRSGIDIEGVNYGAIEATLDRTQGANVWITFAIREGKNREVRNVLAHLGLDVNRLIRVSYGPFQLGELAEGAVEEVKTRVLRDQLGERVAKLAGADFDSPLRTVDDADAPAGKKRGDKPVKTTRAGLIADRKGRRVLVERKRTDEPENDGEPDHHPPRRSPRHYHGKNERGGDRSGGRSGGSAPRKR
jgi:23S rRNA pseudouridine2605 synthase